MSTPPVNVEEWCANGRGCIERARQTISEDLKEGKINHVNLKIKGLDREESPWYYKVDFYAEGDDLIIQDVEGDEIRDRLPLQDLDYLKLRPFYCAVCIGAKSFTFHNNAFQKGGTQ